MNFNPELERIIALRARIRKNGLEPRPMSILSPPSSPPMPTGLTAS